MLAGVGEFFLSSIQQIINLVILSIMLGVANKFQKRFDVDFFLGHGSLPRFFLTLTRRASIRRSPCSNIMAVGKTLDFGILRPVTAAGVVGRDERGGRIPQEVRIADFRIQAIVGHHHHAAAFGQRRRREAIMGDLLKSCCEPNPVWMQATHQRQHKPARPHRRSCRQAAGTGASKRSIELGFALNRLPDPASLVPRWPAPPSSPAIRSRTD